MGKVEVTRQELYNLVWSKPMSKLALEYNLSDNGLRKICKKFDIPLPQLGHWQKIQFNKKVKIIPLPKDFNPLNAPPKTPPLCPILSIRTLCSLPLSTSLSSMRFTA